MCWGIVRSTSGPHPNNFILHMGVARVCPDILGPVRMFWANPELCYLAARQRYFWELWRAVEFPTRLPYYLRKVEKVCEYRAGVPDPHRWFATPKILRKWPKMPFFRPFFVCLAANPVVRPRRLPKPSRRAGSRAKRSF